MRNVDKVVGYFLKEERFKLLSDTNLDLELLTKSMHKDLDYEILIREAYGKKYVIIVVDYTSINIRNFDSTFGEMMEILLDFKSDEFNKNSHLNDGISLIGIYPKRFEHEENFIEFKINEELCDFMYLKSLIGIGLLGEIDEDDLEKIKLMASITHEYYTSTLYKMRLKEAKDYFVKNRAKEIREKKLMIQE